MRNFTVFLSAAVKGRTTGYAVHGARYTVRGTRNSNGEMRNGEEETCQQAAWQWSVRWGDWTHVAQDMDVSSWTLKKRRVTWKETKLTSWATIYLWITNPLCGATQPFSSSPDYLHEGSPPVRLPLPKQRCWQRKFLISCFVCICHCFVIGATRTTWQPRWLRPDVPKIIRAHSDEPEAHTASCAMWTGSISQRKSVRGVALNAHSLVYSYTATPLPPFCAFMARTFIRTAVYACHCNQYSTRRSAFTQFWVKN